MAAIELACRIYPMGVYCDDVKPLEPAPRCHLPGHRHGYLADKDAYLKRLNRITGQVRGIARMLEQEQYCIDILTQVSAATKALQSVALGLLAEHLSSCVLEAAQQGDSAAAERLAEANQAIARLVKS